MRVKDPSKVSKIIEYVDSFFDSNRRAPSIREIEAGTGISRPTVQRYLVEMNEKGSVRYDGTNIITDYIDALTSQSIARLPVAGLITCGAFRSEEEWKGEFVEVPKSMLGKGHYFVLVADGDSMQDAGIDEGDYVIVRRSIAAEYGSIVVALDDENQNTLKRLEFDQKKNRVYLHPENKRYKDIYPTQLSIQGVAEKVIKNLV